MAGAKLAFTGRVTKVRRLASDSSNTRYEATIRVSRIYKGMTGPAVRVYGNTSGSLCGAGMLRAGQRLGLLLHEPWEIDSFSRILYVDLERVTHGRSYRPRAGDRAVFASADGWA